MADALKALKGIMEEQPLRLSSLEKTDDGGFVTRGVFENLRFTFLWEGVKFICTIQNEEKVFMWVDLGVVPYTAEDREKRQRILEWIQDPNVSLHVTNNQKLYLAISFLLTVPFTAYFLLAEITRVVLRSRSLIQQFREI